MENSDNSATPASPQGAGAATQGSTAPKRGSGLSLLVILILGGGLCAAAYFLPDLMIEKNQATPQINVGGTSVAQYMMDQWAIKYRVDHKADVRFPYDPTGSTDGINKMLDHQFAIAFAHDEMNEEQKKKAKGEVVQVPIVLCGVVPIYNLRNLSVTKELNKEEIEKLANELSAKDAPKSSLEKLEQILADSKYRDAIIVHLAEIKTKLPDEQAKKNLDWALTKAKEKLAKPLNFTADVLAKIFLGEIKDWDDKQLQDLNPGVKLPKHKIIVVHRKDSSGTTQIFTDYLQGASKVWQEKIGKAGSTVNWPVGEAMERNNGVAHYVAVTDGAIGYVDLLFAKAREDETDYGAVQNKEGQFIHAEPENLTAATKELVKNIPDSLSFKLTNKAGANAYPITGVVWAMCYQNQPAANQKTLAEFLHYITHDGQQLADKKKFAQLPPEIIARVDQKIKTIKAQ